MTNKYNFSKSEINPNMYKSYIHKIISIETIKQVNTQVNTQINYIKMPNN